MVYGDNRPYNVALIVPNAPAIRRWLEDHKLQTPTDIVTLAADERVRGLIKRELDECNTSFKGFEAIRDFVLIADDFSTDMLTPKMSLKRRKIIEAYGKLLDALYTAPRAASGANASAA
jgi:long-chain acyl-CoA synthetase